MICHLPTARLEKHFELMEQLASLEKQMADLMERIRQNAQELEHLAESR